MEDQNQSMHSEMMEAEERQNQDMQEHEHNRTCLLRRAEPGHTDKIPSILGAHINKQSG